MTQNAGSSDPLDFVKNMWGNLGFSLPGMVTPTLDTDELQKQITDLKAVEGWLRMNLSMLQMTIQNMEMQHSTLTAVKTMSAMAAQHREEIAQESSGTAEAAGAAAGAAASAFSQAAMWPFAVMNQVQEQLQQSAPKQAAAATPKSAPKEKPSPKAATAKTAEKAAKGSTPSSRRSPKST